MEQFYTLLTDIGKAKIANATALQTKVKFTKILVGDSNGSYYEPTETQTKLKNKVWEGGIGNISIDKDNPNWIILESVIPSSVGGFTIREIGIEDSEGDLVVVAKYPQTYKPKIQDGSTKDLIIKTILEVTNVDSITLKVDPTIVLTTKKDLIDSQKNLEEKIDKNFIKKQNNTTWQDININGELETGDTPTLKLHRPNVTDKILLEPFNANFTKLDEVLRNIGAGELKQLSNVGITTIQTPGIYLVYNLTDAPDIPPKENRYYLVKCYKLNISSVTYHHEVYSIGTGKLYTRVWGHGYEDIPCTSPYQPSDLYIDSINGNDDNKGDKEKPVRTWECAYSRIPKIINKPINIRLINIPRNSKLVLSNILYQGEDEYNTRISIQGFHNKIDVLTLLNCNVSGAHYGINVFDVNAEQIILEGCSSAALATCESNHIIIQNGYTMCSGCTSKEYTSRRGAFVNIVSHQTPKELGNYGCSAEYGSRVFVEGNKPTGTTGDKFEAHGGKVEYQE